MAFGLVLLAASWGIMRDSLSILMEGAPKGIDLVEVADAISKLPGVRNIHHVHAWTLTSGKSVFSAHVSTDDAENADSLLKHAHRLLRDRFGFYFSTVQIETVCLDEDHVRDLDVGALLRAPVASAASNPD